MQACARLFWAAGIASLVQRQSGAGRVVKRGYPVNFCYTYSPSTPFRSVRAATFLVGEFGQQY